MTLNNGLTPTDALVLVLEDHKEIHSILRRLFISAGVADQNLIIECSGADLDQLISTIPQPDLVMLNIGLPHKDGYEVFAEMKATPHFKKAKIILYTGHVGIDEVRKAQSLGFDGFLEKPLLLECFPDQLRRILAGESVWEGM